MITSVLIPIVLLGATSPAPPEPATEIQSWAEQSSIDLAANYRETVEVVDTSGDSSSTVLEQQRYGDRGTYVGPARPLSVTELWNRVVAGRCAGADDAEIYFQVYVSCLPAGQPAPQVPVVRAPGGPRTVSVTRSQVSKLLAKGSGITRQPPSARTRLDMPVIAYTSASPQVLNTTILGTPVTITATPVSYAWDWGDGTTTRGTDPGAPYPDHTVFHYYDQPAKDLKITVTTTWSATFTTPGQGSRPVQGSITTTNTTTPFEVRAYTAVLTDQAEEAQGH
ncbi:Uncharacterised protein [Actinomyces bovis]|uniref:PKD domain-containing protein n=1 Tax=Actinomyces bovis TaxID=1658 RepID=A0ABY1VKN4_9ACTO|nr:Uncharacterised protein [Actinomyces bovis]VEG54576.1 Uncharacterised protein [Actinomyces israelii]